MNDWLILDVSYKWFVAVLRIDLSSNKRNINRESISCPKIARNLIARKSFSRKLIARKSNQAQKR